MRNAVIKYVLKLARRDRNVLLISGDLGYGVLDDFRKELPKQYFNAGICEQSMSSIAAGLALNGKKVYTYSIGNFPTLRCLEQIRNDICYHEANVKIIAVGGGFAYGALGMSHHATEDIAIMRSLPHMMVFSPADAREAELVAKQTAKTLLPCYIRLNKGGEPMLHNTLLDSEKYVIGQGIPLREGKDACILCTGAIAMEAIEAAEKLWNHQGLTTAVYSFPCIKPLDELLIASCAKHFRYILTVEEHNIIGGFGSAVAEAVTKVGAPVKVVRMGLEDRYSSIVGEQSYLRHVYGIDSEAIVRKVLENHKEYGGN